MAKRLFDTSFLIDHWRQFPDESERTEAASRGWAKQLIEIHSTNLICTPVLIEVLAGTRDRRDLELHRAYLGEFNLIDELRIPPAVWQRAQELAQRVRSDTSTRARDFADCLIKAIAESHHCEVLASDRYYRGRNF